MLRIGLWALMGVSVVIFILLALKIFSTTDRAALYDAIDPVIQWTYVLLAVAACIAVLLPLMQIVLNPKSALKTLLALLVLICIVFVAYLMSSSDPIVTASSSSNPDFSDPTVLKWTDTGMYTTFILMCGAICMFILSGIKSLFSR